MSDGNTLVPTRNVHIRISRRKHPHHTRTRLMAALEAAAAERDFRTALKHADRYLSRYTDDLTVIRIKAEACLSLGISLPFVGQAVTRLIQEPTVGEQVVQLKADVDKTIQQRLVKARSNTSQRLAMLQGAVDLAPEDGSVALAAGLILLNAPEDEDVSLGLLAELLGATSRRSEAEGDGAERFFRLALRRSAPGAPVHHKALHCLTGILLKAGKVGEALSLASEASGAPVAEVTQYAFGQIAQGLLTIIRVGALEQALPVLTLCLDLMPADARLHLAAGEFHLRREQRDEAAHAFNTALACVGQPENPPDLMHVRTAWDMLHSQRMPCPHCQAETSPAHAACDFCGGALKLHQLMADRYGLADAPPAAIAHVGLAEVCLLTAHVLQAVQQLDMALTHLDRSSQVAAVVEATFDRLMTAVRTQTEAEARMDTIRAAINTGHITTQTVSDLTAICERSAQDWALLPPESRITLVELLMDARRLQAAQRILASAFTDLPDHPAVADLQGRLTAALEATLGENRQHIEQAITAGHQDLALRLADEALALDPASHAARVLRGYASLMSAHSALEALKDFRAVLAACADPALTSRARIGCALALETQFDFDGARTALGADSSPDAQRLRKRLERQQRGIPFIRLHSASHVVMHDTLESVPVSNLQIVATFGIALRMVGRPWTVSAENWTAKVTAAAFEFVQMLGGLRNIPGDPVFVLRFVSHPDTQLPERGRLELALLARVATDDASAAHEPALHLWETLHDILPCTQENVYSFQPITDEGELERLIEPFTVAHVAEIRRRENTSHDAERPYAVYPLLPGSADLHNLCWALLRQKKPALLSIHLLPTDVMAWERTALSRNITSDAHDGEEDVTLATNDSEIGSAMRWRTGGRLRHN